MLCKKCGAQIPDDSAKCEFCGEVFREEPVIDENTENMDETKVINLDSDASQEPNTEQSSFEETNSEIPEDLSQRSTHEILEENKKRRQKQTEQIIDEKQQQLEEITLRRNSKKQKQKRNKIILVACVCVLVVAAAGLGTYYVKNGGFDKTVIATPAPSGSPIPTLSPVETPAVSTPSPTAEAATEKPENSSTANNQSTSSSSGSNTSSSGSVGSSSGTGTRGTGNTSGNNSTSSGNSGGSSSNSGKSNGSSASSSSNVSAPINTNNYSGSVSNQIVSKLVTGDKVIYDQPSNKYFMTFNMDGVMYYAHVSEGSTTEQVHGKSITISAEPTNGRYDGNTVYEITSMTYYDGDYILPDSGTKLIQKSEIQDFTKDKLGLARNEIYARHGRKFQMEVYQNYFNGKSWYKVNPNYDYTDDNKNLNSIELQNVSTILSVENSK